MNYYCFTMRKCTPVKTHKQAVRVISDYEYYLQKMKILDEGMHIEYHYECVDKLNGSYNVHLHAMLKTPNKYIRIEQKKGFSIRCEQVRCKQAWNLYITKSHTTKDEILNMIYNKTQFSHDSIEDELIDIPDAPEDSIIYKKKLFS